MNLGTFTIQQKASKLYLDCAADSSELHLSGKNGDDNPYQRWIIEEQEDANGLYTITQVATQRSWTSSEGVGSKVQVYSDVDGCWHIGDEDGYKVFIRVGEGNYMDCDPEKHSRPYLNKHNVGNPYQQWELTPVA